MANPNTAARYITKNPAVGIRGFRGKSAAMVFANTKRKEGYLVRKTRSFNGYRELGGARRKIYRFNVYWYAMETHNG